MRAFWIWACLYAQVWDISFGRSCAYSHWAVIEQDLVKREGNAHVFLQISSCTCKQAHLSTLKVFLDVRGCCYSFVLSHERTTCLPFGEHPRIIFKPKL